MKSGFSLSQRYIPAWHGNRDLPSTEQLVVVMSMPEVQDVFKIIDQFTLNGVVGSVDTLSLGMKRNTAIAREAGEYVPKYMKLEGADDFSVDDVVKYLPYFDLAVELLFEMVRWAQPTEADEKN